MVENQINKSYCTTNSNSLLMTENQNINKSYCVMNSNFSPPVIIIPTYTKNIKSQEKMFHAPKRIRYTKKMRKKKYKRVIINDSSTDSSSSDFEVNKYQKKEYSSYTTDSAIESEPQEVISTTENKESEFETETEPELFEPEKRCLNRLNAGSPECVTRFKSAELIDALTTKTVNTIIKATIPPHSMVYKNKKIKKTNQGKFHNISIKKFIYKKNTKNILDYYLELENEISTINNCDYISIYKILKSLNLNYNNIEIQPSKLKDAIMLMYNNNKYIYKRTHINAHDLTNDNEYYLYLGYIHKKHINDFKNIIIYCINNYNCTTHNFIFLEGELELLIFQHWLQSGSNLFKYPSNFIKNPKIKKLLLYLIYNLNEKFNNIEDYEEKMIHFSPFFQPILNTINFNDNNNIPVICLYFIQNNYNNLLKYINTKDVILWNIIFKKFNLHSTLFDYYIKSLLTERLKIFNMIFNELPNVQEFHSCRSLFCACINNSMLSHTKHNEYVFKAQIIKNLFHYIKNNEVYYVFQKIQFITSELCLTLDNFVMCYIKFFVHVHEQLDVISLNSTDFFFKYFLVLPVSDRLDFTLNDYPEKIKSSILKAIEINLNKPNVKIDSNVIDKLLGYINLHINYAVQYAIRGDIIINKNKIVRCKEISESLDDFIEKHFFCSEYLKPKERLLFSFYFNNNDDDDDDNDYDISSDDDILDEYDYENNVH